MDLTAFLEQHLEWLPLFIFCARIVDVTVGTIRTIFVVRGRRGIATMLGLVEVTVWVLAIASVVNYLNQPLNIVAYAAGFACGNFIGVSIENKLAFGEQIVRLISRDNNRSIAERLRKEGFGVTEVAGHGREQPVEICFIAVERRKTPRVIRLAREVDPNVFVTIEDLRSTNLRLRRDIPQRSSWRAALMRK